MTSHKKLVSIIGISIVFLLIYSGCKKRNPEIETTILLSNITEDEYIAAKDNNVRDDITINDFKKLFVEVKLKKSKTANERTISIPDLFLIDQYDYFRSSEGGSYSPNYSRTLDTIESMSYVIFYSKGLSEDDIRNIYKNKEIYISYRIKGENLVEEKISIGENLKIEN